MERVALGSGRLDHYDQAHAIDDTFELERSKPRTFKRAGRDGYGKGADLDGHWLGGWIDPVAGAPQDEAGIKIEMVGVWRFAEVDLELGAKGAEGNA